VIKKIFRFFLYLIIASFVYVLIIKLVAPPITITQITNAFGLGLKRDYISWGEMGYNIKLAAIASEDQSFTDHSGFDWDAMEKSLHPKKKNKKSKIPFGGGASTISHKVFAWVLDGNKISKRGIELGDRDTRLGEWVVKSGLAAGDKVLRNNASSLKDGQVFNLRADAAVKVGS
jgi:hypothetical protein